jgi:HEAT repeat protein
MVAVRQWRYSSAVLATFVVALGNISLFLGVALAQGNLEESVGDECSIANIKQYVAQIEKTYSSELETKFKKCAAVAVPWLIEQTKVNNADTQVTAISLLAMIGTPASSAAPRLIELLQRSQNEDLRILAVGALPTVASAENLKSIITVLSSTLKDKNQDLRFGSALSLANLYKNGNKIFFSSDNADALRKIISKEVVPTLITAFRSDDIRLIAVDALRQIGEDAMPALTSALQDKDDYVRAFTAYALGAIGKDAIPALTSALQDKVKDVRTAAVNSLGRIGKDAIPALTSTLQNNDKDMRTAAVNLLGRIGKDAIPALTSALQNNDKDVRTAAVNSLGRIGKDAIPALTSALQDKDKDVRTAAANSLERINININSRPSTFEGSRLQLAILGDQLRIASVIINKRNQPKICESSLAAVLIGWKCPRN